jgi:hypothetical protein
MTYQITNEHIYKSFILGAKYVIREKDQLNAINVFPVADGDTGSNLASLMKSIILKSKMGANLHETLTSISNAALFGARGNSGIIFAEYIHGFTSSVHQDPLTLSEFVNSMKIATKKAYASIEKPVEGTMITLMRRFSEVLEALHRGSKDVLSVLQKAVESLKDELPKTKEQLQVLKDSDVVDAGAKGYLHFITGFTNAFLGEDIEIESHDVPEAHIHVESFGPDQTRYCTEVLIEGKDMNLDQVRNLLHPLGDSMVVAGHESLIRVHIHTNAPDKVFEQIEPVGTIVDQKVDDMKRQFEVANHKKYKVALVTDSIADLPVSYVEDNQIHVFNIAVTINEVTHFDKLTIKNERFYQMMDTLKTYPKSAAPNPKSIENLYSFLTTYYCEILVITVSSKMSATYNTFVQAKALFADKKITIVDSIQNSAAEGLLVYEANEQIKQGKSLDEVVAYIESLKKKTKILVSVKTLKYMVRSGRVKKVVGIAGKIMNLKPVISIDEEGNGIIFDKAFSQKMSDKKIFNHIASIVKNYGIKSYALVHVNASTRADYYASKLEALTGIKPLYTSDISTIIAMNSGIGTVAVAYIRKD